MLLVHLGHTLASLEALHAANVNLVPLAASVHPNALCAQLDDTHRRVAVVLAKRVLEGKVRGISDNSSVSSALLENSRQERELNHANRVLSAAICREQEPTIVSPVERVNMPPQLVLPHVRHVIEARTPDGKPVLVPNVLLVATDSQERTVLSVQEVGILMLALPPVRPVFLVDIHRVGMVPRAVYHVLLDDGLDN